jgi:iron complex transport system substrate-binding protein
MRPAVILSILLLLSFVLSCTNRKDSRSITESLSDSSSILKSRRFSIHKNDSCTILTITDPWQGAKEIRNEYYLVERGQENSLKVHTSQIISVPVRKIICMSSTHLAMISALGEEESIYGLSGTNYIYDPKIRARADDGLIGEIGYDAGINSELILRISPDLIMMYGIGSESAGYVGKISELGIKVMYNADYLENDPLERFTVRKNWQIVFITLLNAPMMR